MSEKRISKKQVKDKLEVQGIYSEGYGIIAKKVMRDNKLSMGAKALYSYIASFAGAGETAWPGRTIICRDLGITKNTFTKYLQELKTNNYIDVSQAKDEKRKFFGNVYTIVTNPCPKNEDTVPCPTFPCPKKRDTVNEDTNNNRSNINNLKKQQQPSPEILDVQADEGGNPAVAVDTSKNTKTGLEQNELLDKLQKLGIGKKKAEDLINKFDAARIKELINLVISDHKIKKKAGFVIKALEDGYLLPDLDAQPKEDHLKLKTEKYLRELKEAEKNADYFGFNNLLQMVKTGRIWTKT